MKIKSTEDLVTNVVKARLQRNQNWLCVITGDTGTGKSFSSLRLGSLVDEDFRIENVVFDIKELIDLIEVRPPGSLLVLDEAGISFGSRDFMSKQNKVMSSVIQMFRFKQIALIWTLPDISMIDIQARRLMHNFLETQPIDYKKEQTRVKWFEVYIDRWTGEFRHRFMKVETGNMGFAVVKVVNFNKPSEDLIKSYEKKKKQAFENLLSTARNKLR